MKKQTITTTATYLFGGVFFIALLFLLGPAMHQALGQGNTGKRSVAKPNLPQVMPSLDGTVAGTYAPAKPAPNIPASGRSQLPLSSGTAAQSMSIPAPPKAPQVVLYDQYNNASTTATLSATFTDFATFSADLADDFVVPAGQTWNVQSIDADGQYFNGAGPATDWNVKIYADSAGLPGAQVFSATNQPVTVVGTTFTVNLPVAAVLTAGTYWVEIQANMTFGTQGEWGWTDRTVQSNSPAAWQNPGGGFGVCPTWMPKLATCVPSAGGPDQVFRLNGTTGGGGGGTCYTISQIGGSIVPGTTDIGNHGDDTVVTIALPFSYMLYDQTFNSINLSSNGNAQFTTTDTTFTNVCLPWAAHNYTIFPYWDDLYLVNSGFGIFTSVSGTAPNRIFNIEWRAQYFPGSGSAGFELRLYEGQTRFDVIYGTVTNGNTSATAGVQKDIAPNFTQYFCNGVDGAATGGQSYILSQACPTPTPTPPCSWRNEPPMANARRNPATAVVGSNLYAITGFDLNPNYSTANERFDGTSWMTLAPIPVPHAQSRGAAVGTNIYVPGGFNNVSFSGPLDTMQIYNTTANTWSAGMTLPAARSGVATAAFNGLVYVIAGYNPVGTGHNEVYIYNPGTNSYTTGAPMPATQGNVPGVLLGGEIYVAGGGTAPGAQFAYNPTTNMWRTIAALPTTGGTCQSGNGFVLDNELWVVGCLGLPISQQVWIYNPGTNSWRAGPLYNVDHQGPGAALFNARGFAVGGGTASGGSAAVESIGSCAPPCSGMWTLGTPYPITDVRYGFAQTATHFYVFGGVSNGTRVNNVNRMDLATEMWQARAPMPFASEAPTCALMASTGIVYCAEGDTGSGFASYNIATDTWTPLASIPGGDHYGSASGAFSGKVFVAGGTTGFSSAVQVYDVATNTWSPGTAAPNDFLLAGYQQVGQYLYVVGGFEASGPNQVGAEQSSVLNRGQQSKQPKVPSANNATTWRLDMSSAPGVWSVGPAFAQGRADFGLAYDAGTNKLYALGGDAPGGSFFDSTNLVDELSLASWPGGSWAASPPNLILPNRQANQAGFYGAGQIWSVGGIDGSTFTFLAEVQRRANSCAPVPSSAVSRKVHGAAGTFEVNLPLVAIDGAVGIECRTGAVAGAHQEVITFATPVTVSGVAVTSGTGSATFSGNGTAVITVDLTGVTNAQRLGVTLMNVSNGPTAGDVMIPMGVLSGDTNANGSVNAGDVAQTKGQSGVPVGAGNFRTDVNSNGAINAGDVAIVKSRAGTSLPP